MNYDIIKQRNSLACIKDAYVRFFAEYKNILKNNWLIILVFCFSISSLFSLSYFIVNIENTVHYNIACYSMMGIFSIIALISHVILTISLRQYCNQKTLKQNLLQWFHLSIFNNIPYLFIGSVVAFIAYCTSKFPEYIYSHLTYAVIFLALIVISLFMAYIFLVIIPQNYIQTKYIFGEKNCLWNSLKSNFKIAFKHYSFLVGSTMVSKLLYYSLYIIFTMPAIVLCCTLYSYYHSANIMGDIVTLPNYFHIISFVIGLTTSIVIVLQSIWMLFVMQNIYGSIEAKNNNKA